MTPRPLHPVSPPPPPPPPPDVDWNTDGYRPSLGERIDFYLACAALWVALFLGIWVAVRGVH